jgi:hypothetical protein
MSGVRRKLTFANVMSVIAVFIAFGGVGYAASKLPKNSVGPKQIRNGAVNEQKLSASAKAALQGAKGDQGPAGPPGPRGPGATSFTLTLAQGTTLAVIATAPNGITVRASCTSAPLVVLRIETSNSSNNLQFSGTTNNGLTTAPNDTGNSPTGAVQTSDPNNADFDGVARDKTVGPFARIDLHGHTGSPCTYWGMITPSA